MEQLDLGEANSKPVDARSTDSRARPVNLRAACLVLSLGENVIAYPRGLQEVRLVGAYHHNGTLRQARLQSPSSFTGARDALAAEVCHLLGHTELAARASAMLDATLKGEPITAHRTITSSDAAGTGPSWAVPMRQTMINIFHMKLELDPVVDLSAPPTQRFYFSDRHARDGTQSRLHLPTRVEGALQLRLTTAPDVGHKFPPDSSLPRPLSTFVAPPIHPFAPYLASEAQII